MAVAATLAVAVSTTSPTQAEDHELERRAFVPMVVRDVAHDPTRAPDPDPTPTPEPTPTPTPDPDPGQTFSGTGSTVISNVELGAGNWWVDLIHDGSSNFIVQTEDSAEKGSLLVNEIGSYDGRRWLEGDETYQVDITADGTWSVQFQAMGSQPGAYTAFTGSGDDVSGTFAPSTTGIEAWHLTHDGSSNFIVSLECDTSRSLVQNEIGAVDSTTVVDFDDANSCFWDVRADGNWTLEATVGDPPNGLSVSGTGQSVVFNVELGAGTWWVDLTHDGSSNFIVHTYDSAEDRSLLVNVIGSYDGRRWVEGNETYLVDIYADGNWTLEFQEMESQPGANTSFSGAGDDVSGTFSPSPGGTSSWHFTHDGESNFIVTFECDTTRGLAQNAIGSVDETATVNFSDANTCFWDVRADGNWTMTRQ